MTTDETVEAVDPTVLTNALSLIDRATRMADEYDDDFRALIQSAADNDFVSKEDKRSLFTRVVTLLHHGGVEPDEAARARLADAVRAEVEDIIGTASSTGPAATSVAPAVDTAPEHAVDSSGNESGAVKLVEHNGLKPHDVVPVPIFKGVAVPMREGYIDVNTIELWQGNHRVELHVQEFRDREGREPNDGELLQILQGELVAEGEKDDPFDIAALARSIATKGVERPPILTWDGEPKDGNRRIAAAKYVQTHKGYTDEERERARWVRVWVTPNTTDDVIDSIVVALNFEPDHKQEWEEYVKARLVVRRYKSSLDARVAAGERFTPSLDKRVKVDVAGHFAILPGAVTRYIRMVRWADDFEAYHVEERGLDEAKVRYRANDIFQWFFEMQAGRGEAVKLTTKLDADDDLKPIVYDLMYDVIDSGAQVRALHKVISDEPALKLLGQAHEQAESDKAEAKKLVAAAVAEAAKNATTRKTGFEQFLKTAVERFGSAPPKQWESVDTQLLRDLRKTLPGVIGAIDGELADRDMITQPAAG